MPNISKIKLPNENTARELKDSTARAVFTPATSSASGTQGQVPAPTYAEVTAGKFLKADGTWDTPAGGTTPTGNDILLTGYTQGSDTSAVAATDKVNEAIAKHENKIATNQTNILSVEDAVNTKLDKTANAASAAKLNNGTTDYSVGSATKGVYFNNGVPTAMTHSVNTDVPSDALFTDTTYSSGTGITINASNAINHSNSVTAQTTASALKVAYDAQGHITGSSALAASDVGAIATTAKGANNGVAELDANGKVPSSQLPSYVDDVLEYSAKSSFPTTGEAGKIYVDTTTNLTYRWSGTAYVEISPSLALGTTSSTAYYGDKGKTAYDHSQITSGNPHNVTKTDVGLGNVGNFKAVSTDANQGLSDTEKSNARANIGAGTSSLTIGTSSTQAAAGNHIHDLSIEAAASGSTASVNLSANAIYTLTAGGKTYNFKTPADNNSNTIACAYCSTAAGTAAKTASCTDYALLDKSYLIVTIKTANSSASALTLNVNGKGAKSIYINGTASSSSNYTLPAGTYIVYYSTNYYFRTDGKVTTAGMVDIGGNTTKYFRGDGSLADPPGTYSLPTASDSQLGGVKIGSNISNNSGTISLSSTNVTDALGYTPLQSHQTIRQDGVTGATVNRFGTCGTAAATAAKTVSITSGTFSLEAGARVSVKFTYANTAGTPTLNVNSTGAKNIYSKGSQITTDGNKALLAGTVDFIYDGTQYHLIGNYIDTNTTYSGDNSAISIATGNVITHATGAGYKHIPAAGSTGQFLGYDSAGTAKWVNNPNTDTKVNVTLATTSKAYLLGTTTTPTSTATGVTSVADTNVYLDTTAGKLTASTINAGSFTGNGVTASATSGSSALITSGGVYTALSGKQNSLSTSQLAAVNSGIDSTKVGQISTNQNNISSTQDMICDNEFSTSTAYAIGDIVTYNNSLYEFTSAHSAGAWNSADVTQIDVVGIIGNINSVLEAVL